MQVDISMDLMFISLRKTVSVILRSDSPRIWTGKFADFENGELKQPAGGESIRYIRRRNPFFVSGIDFFLGDRVLCEFRSPFFSHSHVLVDGKRFDFSFKNYINGHEPGLKGVTFQRGYDWTSPGSVRFDSEDRGETEMLAFGLVAMYFEYLNAQG